jgi:prolyl-tRNA synthetase
LVLPPKLAYLQVVIVPIHKKDNADKVDAYAKKIHNQLSKEFRVRLDSREGYSPGYKFNEWELKGIPIRIEIGQREMDADKLVIVRRDTGEKSDCGAKDAKHVTEKLLDEIHKNLYSKAQEFLKSNIHIVTDYKEFKKVLEEKKGIIQAPWCGSEECEKKIKEETGAKITNLPFEHGDIGNKCIYCGKDPKHELGAKAVIAVANFAKSY